MFASQTQQKTIPVPFDTEQTVTIRKLTGSEIEKAQAESLKSVIAGKSARARARLMAALVGAKEFGEADVRAAYVDPLISYDRMTLAHGGLVAWTYPDKSDKATGRPLAAAIDDLDDDALEFVALEVLKLSKPALFQTASEAETERKNG